MALIVIVGLKREESKAISVNISTSFVNKRISGDTRRYQFCLSSSFLAGDQNFAFCYQRSDQKQKKAKKRKKVDSRFLFVR